MRVSRVWWKNIDQLSKQLAASHIFYELATIDGFVFNCWFKLNFQLSRLELSPITITFFTWKEIKNCSSQFEIECNQKWFELSLFFPLNDWGKCNGTMFVCGDIWWCFPLSAEWKHKTTARLPTCSTQKCARFYMSVCRRRIFQVYKHTHTFEFDGHFPHTRTQASESRSYFLTRTVFVVFVRTHSLHINCIHTYAKGRAQCFLFSHTHNEIARNEHT